MQEKWFDLATKLPTYTLDFGTSGPNSPHVPMIGTYEDGRKVYGYWSDYVVSNHPSKLPATITEKLNNLHSLGGDSLSIMSLTVFNEPLNGFEKFFYGCDPSKSAAVFTESGRIFQGISGASIYGCWIDSSGNLLGEMVHINKLTVENIGQIAALIGAPMLKNLRDIDSQRTAVTNPDSFIGLSYDLVNGQKKFEVCIYF
jgi:hypothetical protein